MKIASSTISVTAIETPLELDRRMAGSIIGGGAWSSDCGVERDLPWTSAGA